MEVRKNNRLIGTLPAKQKPYARFTTSKGINLYIPIRMFHDELSNIMGYDVQGVPDEYLDDIPEFRREV